MDGAFQGTFNTAQQTLAGMQGELRALNKVQSDISGFERQQTAVQNTEKRLAILKKEYDDISKQMKDTGESSGELETKLLKKELQIDRTSQALDKQKEALNTTTESLHKAGVNTEDLGSASQMTAGKIEELKQEQEQAAEAAEKMGVKSAEAVQNIQQALVAAGIVKLLKEITDAAFEMANEFSRAESTIAKSSGATGRELDALTESMRIVGAVVPESLADVSDVMGTLNTMTGLTGAELEALTKQTLEYARVNNEAAGQSAMTLGRLMNALDRDAAGLGLTMDQLTLAGQMSGVSVNQLSEYIIQAGPSFEEMGFGLERSIALFSSFYKAGAEPRELLSSLNILLNRMAKEGATNAEEAFNMLLEQIKAAPDILSATTIASEAFGAKVGAKVADDIRAGRFEIDEWVDAIAGAEGTLLSTAAAALTLEEEWAQASNAMKIAFESALGPSLSEASSLMAGLTETIAGFIADNPELVQAAAAFAAVLGVVVVALGAYTVAAKAAAIMSGVFQASLGPIMWVATGVAALIGVFVGLSAATREAEDEFKNLSATSRNQLNEIRALEAEYEALTAAGRGNSAEAQVLKAEIDNLTAAFERNRMTVEQVAEAHRNTMDTLRANREAAHDSIAELDNRAEATTNLVARLKELSEIEGRSNAQKEEMLTITQLLNEQVPSLNLSYNMQNDTLNQSLVAIEALNNAEIARDRRNTNRDNYNQIYRDTQNALTAEANALAQVEQATRAVEDAKTALANMPEGYIKTGSSRNFSEADAEAARQAGEYMKAQMELDELNAQLLEFQGHLAEASAEVRANQADLAHWTAELERSEAALAEFESIAEEANRSMEQMTAYTADLVVNIEALSEAYTAVYDAALTSVRGQYNLWDEVGKIAEIKAKDIMAALESQTQHWQTYNENLMTLRDRTGEVEGLSDVIASFADGSEESTAAIAAMAAMGSDDLAAMVASWQTLQAEQEAVADNIAELVTDFSNELDRLESELADTIANMNMSDEAGAAGAATIQAFIDAADRMLPQVTAAYNRIAQAASTALSSASPSGTSFNISGLPGHSSGLEYVPYDDYVARLHKGERVLTAEENDFFTIAPQLLMALAARADVTEAVNSPIGGGGMTISIGDINVGMGDGGAGSAQFGEGLKEAIIETVLEYVHDEERRAYK